MKKITVFLPILCFANFLCLQAIAQKLHTRWDEITASDWNNALTKSNKTCILPIGILEKHGPHVPIGSDLIRVREYALRATQKEYAVVFPDYFLRADKRSQTPAWCICVTGKSSMGSIGKYVR